MREREFARPTDRELARADSPAAVEPAPAIRPGKRTLVETETLPFAAEIQRSFGRHDVSSVRAAIGGAAREAAARLGARAFAAGDLVAFAAAPDLHLAAHEAAHVVQQRAGAARADDPDLERHADAVADAVVAGRSAERLLDRFGGSRGGTSERVVQRKATHVPTAAEEDARLAQLGPDYAAHGDARRYYFMHDDAFDAAFRVAIAAERWPLPEALTWRATREQLADTLTIKLTRDDAYDLFAACLPANVWDEIDRERVLDQDFDASSSWRPAGEMWWHPAVATRVGKLLVTRLHDSFARMGERRARAGAAPIGLVTSCVLDQMVGDVLCDPAAVAIAPDAPVRPDILRTVTVPWADGPDGPLWNCVRPNPLDATPEEVSYALFLTTQHAIELECIADLYVIPVELASQQRVPRAHTDLDIAAAVLASPQADHAALVEAPPPNPCPDQAAVVDAVEASLTFAYAISKHLVAWRSAALADLPRALAARRAHVAGPVATDLAELAPVLAGQRDRLRDVLQLVETAETVCAPKLLEPPHPMLDVLAALRQAADTSILARTGQRRLERLREMVLGLPAALTSFALHAARDVLHHEDNASDSDGALADRADALCDELATGTTAADFNLRLERVTLAAEVKSRRARLADSRASMAAALAHGSSTPLTRVQYARVVDSDYELLLLQDAIAKPEHVDAKALETWRVELRHILDTYGIDTMEFDDRVTEAVAVVDGQKQFDKLAMMIGIALLTDGVGALAGESVAGYLSGGAVDSVIGGLASSGTRLIVGSLVSAKAQSAVTGGSFADAAFDSLVGNLASAAVLKTFRAVLLLHGVSPEVVAGSWMTARALPKAAVLSMRDRPVVRRPVHRRARQGALPRQAPRRADDREPRDPGRGDGDRQRRRGGVRGRHRALAARCPARRRAGRALRGADGARQERRGRG